jgi:hypothetical protein
MCILTFLIVGCSRQHGSQEARKELPPSNASQLNQDNVALRLAVVDPWARLVLQTDGVLPENHPWRTYFPDAALEQMRPREYWVVSTPGVEVSWIPVYPGPHEKAKANLKQRFYFIRGFGVGNETRLAELLLDEVRRPRVVDVAGIPMVLEDTSSGVRFVGEAGTLNPGAHVSFFIQRLVTSSPCPPRNKPNTCAAQP